MRVEPLISAANISARWYPKVRLAVCRFRPNRRVRIPTPTARTSVSTWPESLTKARLWPRKPPVNSMMAITADMMRAIQRRFSALREDAERSRPKRGTAPRALLKLRVLEMGSGTGALDSPIDQEHSSEYEEKTDTGPGAQTFA